MTEHKKKTARSGKVWQARKRVLDLITNAFIVFLIVLIASGNYICPFLYLFKIPCPGCGMTRACKALLRLDFRAAIHYNYLFPIPILWVGYQSIRRYLQPNTKWENLFLFLSILLFIIRWLIILFK